jgi:hypothetical protein
MATVRRSGPARCRRKFLKFFPGGFRDETYLAWERDYKWATHKRWTAALRQAEFSRLLGLGQHAEIAARAIRVEQQSRHSMIFSFEKMALRDAVRSAEGAERFARGLYDYLHGAGSTKERFTRWVDTVAALPRKQTRVLTWPLVTVFGFIARPRVHIFLKPTVTRLAAEQYGFDFRYESRPNWQTYHSLLNFARQVRADILDLGPRDMIDIQSFLWVQGSSEYD